jgi:uncharacterized OsmC-like protein
MVTIKPKQFGPVFVKFDGADMVSFAQDDPAQAQESPPRGSPVATLMIAVGHCLVESIRIIARREQMALQPFMISVRGEKALDLPGRLKTIRCAVIGHPVADAEQAAALVAEAKGICTVSNTLNCEILVKISDPDEAAG